MKMVGKLSLSLKKVTRQDPKALWGLRVKVVMRNSASEVFVEKKSSILDIYFKDGKGNKKQREIFNTWVNVLHAQQ